MEILSIDNVFVSASMNWHLLFNYKQIYVETSDIILDLSIFVRNTSDRLVSHILKKNQQHT